ncbi:MAG: aspartate ammonia-lyase [Chloroflexi bacterium]|nr:aspartate ammonia-lyase [Chloroflexota bacterium]MCY3583049.1 aspartate ammonia-lyase [Chloroflexota bacterium]MCY3717693.1 aspartate ammonia-lyase [Chloroflexota bacterium]MXX50432.1 aspartate ammonia-lyase [Chloroflexota bacterium]MXX83471.1 aspartate ammonia-lyase [Chloroflexota bacterium]
MADYRIEMDSLGEVRVPAEALYAAQTQRALQNFPITGMKPLPAFIWSMALIKRAAAEVNRDLGLLDATLANAIIQAGDEVLAGQHHQHFVVDPFQAGAGTSHNMNTNEVLANRANQILGYAIAAQGKPVHANDHVNMAQSTNDTIPTAIRLGALWRLDELLATLGRFVEVARAKAAAWDNVVKTGRTHLQDAVPIRLGQEVGAWASAIERQMDKARFAAEGLRRLGIGGTAAGTGLNAHPDYHALMVAKLSALSGLILYESDDLFESMQSMQDAVFFSAALRNLAMDFTRIANDVRLLSAGPTTGIAELTCPPVQPGSSIMPGKVNPVLAEMLNQAMYHCMGNDTTVNLCGAAGQFELNVMMPVIAHNLNETMQVMISAVGAFTEKLLVGLEVNRERTASWLARNPILVTALNPIIGYNNGAKVAKKALAEGKSVREVVLELGLMDADELDAALDAQLMTEGGIRG